MADVFVNLWNNRKEDGAIQNIEGYLYIAVKNRSLNYINRVPQKFVEISERNTLDINQLVDPFDPEKEMELQELQHDIRIAIDTLPPQSKAVFQMIKEEGFKYKEVAEILNISPRTVETQLVRALKRLDIALMPYLLKKSKKKRTIPDQLPPFLFLILSYLAG